MKNSFKPRQMTLLGLLSGILIVMSVTPLGYLRFGALSITLNMIPVAIAAVAMGPLGGAITGLVFGLTSFFAALTGGSSMGIIMMNISPALTFVQSVLPRLAMGICVGLLYRWMHRVTKKGMAAYAAGFSAALNAKEKPAMVSLSHYLFLRNLWLRGFIDKLICIQSRKGVALCIEKKNKIVYTEFIKAEKDGAVR